MNKTVISQLQFKHGINGINVNNQKEYYARITPDLKSIEKIEKVIYQVIWLINMEWNMWERRLYLF